MDQRSDGATLENRAGDAAGAATGLRRRLFGRLGVAMGLGWMMAAASASGHSGVILIPPTGDYLIRWYQPHNVRPVDNWQIEVTRHRTPGTPFLATVRMIPDPSCWALNVPVNEAATARVRAVAGARVSVWSRAISLPSADGYLIRWFQSNARPVDDWDIEVSTVRNPNSPYISTALVMPDAQCWGLTVPVNESANVRMRSVVGSQYSAWSGRTSVPEVGLGVGILSSAALLAGLDRRRRS